MTAKTKAGIGARAKEGKSKVIERKRLLILTSFRGQTIYSALYESRLLAI